MCCVLCGVGCVVCGVVCRMRCALFVVCWFVGLLVWFLLFVGCWLVVMSCVVLWFVV